MSAEVDQKPLTLEQARTRARGLVEELVIHGVLSGPTEKNRETMVLAIADAIYVAANLREEPIRVVGRRFGVFNIIDFELGKDGNPLKYILANLSGIGLSCTCGGRTFQKSKNAPIYFCDGCCEKWVGE